MERGEIPNFRSRREREKGNVASTMGVDFRGLSSGFGLKLDKISARSIIDPHQLLRSGPGRGPCAGI